MPVTQPIVAIFKQCNALANASFFGVIGQFKGHGQLLQKLCHWIGNTDVPE